MAKKHHYYSNTSAYDEAIRTLRNNIQFSDIDPTKIIKDQYISSEYDQVIKTSKKKKPKKKWYEFWR